MTTNDAGGSTETMGPTFGQIAVDARPKPIPVCAKCPKAMWYRTAKRMRAFCRELRHITWEDGEQEPILQCDGYEATLTLPDAPAR